MGLEITNEEEHQDGTMSSATYLYIAEYYKAANINTISLATSFYKSKALYEASDTNISNIKSLPDTRFTLPFSMANFSEVEDTVAALYSKLKSYLIGLGYDVIDA